MTRRPLVPSPKPAPTDGERAISDEERAIDRRFIVRLVAATVALQLAGGLVAGLMLCRVRAGVPPMPSPPPIRGGAIDVRSK